MTYEKPMDIAGYFRSAEEVATMLLMLLDRAENFAEQNAGTSVFIAQRDKNVAFVDYNFFIETLEKYMATVTGNDALGRLVYTHFGNTDYDSGSERNNIQNKHFLMSAVLGLMHRLCITSLVRKGKQTFYNMRNFYTPVAYEGSRKFVLRAAALRRKRLEQLLGVEAMEKLYRFNEDLSQIGYGLTACSKMLKEDEEVKYLVDFK